MKKIVVNGVGVRRVKPDYIQVTINHYQNSIFILI